MEFMQSQSDKSFDLAIVDPPYGIDYAAKPARSKHEKKNWDNDIPNDIYFDELFRISNKCIIWGGNYYKLGFDLTIIEKDPVYYEQAKKRLIEFQRQQVLF